MLHHPGVDAVAAGLDLLPRPISQIRFRYQRARNDGGSVRLHSGNRHRNARSVPVNEIRSGSIPASACARSYASGLRDEVAQRQRQQFLHDARRRAAPQLGRLAGPHRVVVSLLLVEQDFLFPALVISEDHLDRRMGFGIEPRRHQDVLLVMAGALRVLERVRDHAPDRQTNGT